VWLHGTVPVRRRETLVYHPLPASRNDARRFTDASALQRDREPRTVVTYGDRTWRN
jgi:hypothetical protein